MSLDELKGEQSDDSDILLVVIELLLGGCVIFLLLISAIFSTLAIITSFFFPQFSPFFQITAIIFGAITGVLWKLRSIFVSIITKLFSE